MEIPLYYEGIFFFHHTKMPLRKLSGLDTMKLDGKKVLVRADFNVPMKDGVILEDSRIKKVIPTIEFLLKHGAAVILLSHLGRPKGKVVEELRLGPVQKRLSEYLKMEVKKTNDCVGIEAMNAKKGLKPGEVLLLENTRFYLAETENLRPFAGELANDCDLFVQEAFGTVHRAHASTEGVAHFLPAVKGFLVEKEVKMLKSGFEHPKHPLTLVIGGAKIDTKIGVIRNFLPVADTILIGGGLANTFLYAKGFEIGQSLCEKDKAEIAQHILMEAGENKCRILLPKDVVVTKEEVSDHAKRENVPVQDVYEDNKILDIGEDTIKRFTEVIKESKMIIWNGPLGLFEYAPFAEGTKRVAEAIRDAKNAVTLLGGGDTVEALRKFDIPEESFTHVSTGGGAMLEFLEGKVLPGLAVLKEQLTME